MKYPFFYDSPYGLNEKVNYNLIAGEMLPVWKENSWLFSWPGFCVENTYKVGFFWPYKKNQYIAQVVFWLFICKEDEQGKV